MTASDNRGEAAAADGRRGSAPPTRGGGAAPDWRGKRDAADYIEGLLECSRTLDGDSTWTSRASAPWYRWSALTMTELVRPARARSRRLRKLTA